jgi:branched-subunit amino acid transport protein
VSTDLVPLALLMFVATYPSRAIGLLAPGIERMPRRVLDYLQLVGPAVLSALAAVDVMVVVDGGRPAFHVGLSWIAVGACLAIVTWRRNLFLGLVTAVVIAIVGRAAGLV